MLKFRKMPKQNQQLNVEEIKKVIAGTWFDFRDEGDRFVLDTRENGDVGSETPGQPDLREAQRMAKELKRSFPKHEVLYEALDEWVILEVSKKEKSKEKLAQEEQKKMTYLMSQEWMPHIEEALVKASEQCWGESSKEKNYAAPFSWVKAVIPSGKMGTTTFSSKYGERLLYRESLNAIPAFKTPTESLNHFKEFIRSLGGVLKNERITKPSKTLTYNSPPPRNVIEEVGYIVYDVELPAKCPKKTQALGKSVSVPSLAKKSSLGVAPPARQGDRVR